MKFLQFPIFILITLACTQQSEKICRIQGITIDRGSKAIILQKAHEDISDTTNSIRIPITDQFFSYDFQFDDVYAYRLIFEDELNANRWKTIEFFPVDGLIEMTLHPINKFDENEITGSKLTDDFKELERTLDRELREAIIPPYDSLKALKEDNLYYSDSMRVFMAKYNISDEYSHKGDRELNNLLTRLRDSGIAYTDIVNSVTKQIQDERKKNMINLYDRAEERKDILSYYILIDRLFKFEPQLDDIERLISLQNELSSKFKGHPYSKLSADLLWSTENIRIGGNYYDFTLPDINQKNHTLSKQISNKYALLHIWAPWCGPCIKTGREMVPVYEKYKDKGLTALAVVGRYEKLEDTEEIIAKENFPWLHLLDSEWNSEVWINYGLGKAGGGIFLIDNNGKIIAIYPGAEEVEKILSSALN